MRRASRPSRAVDPSPSGLFFSSSEERWLSPRSRPPDIAADDPSPPFLSGQQGRCAPSGPLCGQEGCHRQELRRGHLLPPLRSRSRVRSRDLPSQGENHGQRCSGGRRAGIDSVEPAPPLVFVRAGPSSVSRMRDCRSRRRVASRPSRASGHARWLGKNPISSPTQWGHRFVM